MKAKIYTKKQSRKYIKLLLAPLVSICLLWMSQANAQVLLTESFKGNTVPANVIIGDDAKLTGGDEDPSGNGWLRLTTDEKNEKGYAFVNESFPSTLGVTIEFEYKTWRSKGYFADGIAVFLFDALYGPTGNNIFQPGGYGGSLGYAPIYNQSALTGGYIGLGLDEFGNFSNPIEGRIGGPGQTPNAVVLRGPTTSNPTTTNAYINGMVTPEQIAYQTLTPIRPTDAEFYRKVHIDLYPVGSSYQVDVLWATSPAAPLVHLLSGILYTPPPSDMKVGFTASTGSNVNYHEIRNLIISAYDGGALPIDLLEFTATKNGGQARLNWTTASEQNNTGFDVERSSDGKSWTNLGFVASQAPGGNSSTNLHYSFTDESSVGGENLYRLKQTDLDGQYSYSPIRSLVFADKDISVYPNPTQDKIYVNGLRGGETIRVYDQIGRIVLSQVNTGNNKLQLSLGRLNPGIYILEVRNGSSQSSYQIVLNK